ncbi:DUF1254 domain-containing protein [Mycetocola spongiae]|uniref:DUF1254 domain-containing protein n=1 Tax=Mycetocola spongiae TaxID=2859226 RepID=UPI001CF4C3B7|nr:DUF1254 domain-containing protein [Mycetocola spongiae]UCR88629.1 DUF1254 domain-containing protein [Mycetocola spongiae]
MTADPYLYYYPLVENLRQVRRYLTTGIGSNPAAAANTFSHARKLAGPEDTFVTINNDTIYSMAQLDLSGGPVRLEVPDTGDRYYVLQFVDAWTNNIAYVGTRATGNRAGSFLIVPPGWEGETRLPLIRSSTAVLSIVGRFACTGPEDVAAVAAVQDATLLIPVNPDAALAGIPEAPAAESSAAEEFWAQAESWSRAFIPPVEEAGLIAELSPLWDAGPDERERAYSEGIAKLERECLAGTAPVYNGWTVGLHLFDYNLYALGLGTVDEPRWKNTDPEQRIVDRAVACRLGLWGNHAYEAVYAQAFTDIEGAPLSGEKTYRIIFAERPPVGAFWSITLYDIPRYYLVDNPIDRYSIGDRTAGISYREDGSLRITLAHDEPRDAEERANWLPTPGEAFRLVLRLYVPGEAILNETYTYPEIHAV